ncbi:cytochrome ubiquinol oxidase subunit I [Polynucleobacter sp. JS-Safj-400b-B2]|uniref:cytochrome ubiquinol oxidase subunit I n=1 Tax=Polynucleobacter sp. JS-Safj-400b-B2 TaxID=2576921 RepID=UPI001C0DD1B6|nr:cytochrome ubiquinol oxidase subunit I [Polynucleobacter sp. JS-Safj-400b-B2]MBU3626968.1 cytochrome ubiquinol oxidase subunit I [Polynucleobacter sp. JS-Safj-400b-B2]
MEFFDAVMLARMQFAFTVGFHIIFPAFSIGLASYLALLNGLHLFTQKSIYLDIFNYWVKIFAIAFVMGVVSGLVMSYEFGTNWSVFSYKAGPIVGPLMGYEVMTAFFLEAGFLGVMLFGRERVGPKIHFFACSMVAVGTFVSTFWILSVNSWMQTPAGFSVNSAGQFVPEDWFEIIFNPSFPYRLVHMVLAAYISTALVISAVGALHLLRLNKESVDSPAQKSRGAVCVMFSMALWIIAILVPIQMEVGDQHGLNTLKYQPKKIAAIEGHYEDAKPAGIVVFGIPNDKNKKMDYALEIPYLGSIILTHSLDGEILGMNTWPQDEVPPMALPFFAFRIMVGLGVLMFILGIWSLWLRYQKALYVRPWFLKYALIMGPAGFIAVLAGWVVTEVGRQPYTIYNLLRTSESHSALNAATVGGTLVAFIVTYFFLFGIGVYYILKLMNQGSMNGDPPQLKKRNLKMLSMDRMYRI